MRRAAVLPLLVVLGLAIVVAPSFSAPPAKAPAPGGPALKIAPDIEARRARFVTKPLAANIESLSPGDRKALDHLVAAAKLAHQLFQRQAWQGNPALASRVESLSGPLAQAAREYYRLMAKPWDELEEHEPFLGGPVRPVGAGFYPEDMKKEEFDAWIAAHPADRGAFTSSFTVIRRTPGGKLAAVGYAKEYADLLGRAATELRKAAASTSSPTLAKFLALRADALLSDDYYASDLAWMDIEGAIEVVIGPYETYEDSLFGYKASFESFVCVESPADSAKLARYKEQIPFLEKNLPIGDEHKNLKRGSASPIRVADVVYTAGDARSGVQTIAFNLPNDERVREAKGSKKVLLKNVMQAKYEAILTPIAALALPAPDAVRVDFESYFHFILFHEMSHGLGPGRLVLAGRETEVRLELKELYSAIEEAKADALGVYNLYALAEAKAVPAKVIEPLPWTYTAGLFRTTRFGVAEAHGLGVVIQTNYLLSKGAIEVTPQGLFRPVPEKFRAAISDLARELLMVEALGDYAGAQRLVKTYGTPPTAMLKILAGLERIPVDVDPYYPLFEKR